MATESLTRLNLCQHPRRHIAYISIEFSKLGYYEQYQAQKRSGRFGVKLSSLQNNSVLPIFLERNYCTKGSKLFVFDQKHRTFNLAYCFSIRLKKFTCNKIDSPI
jgi:hypothetical protein